MFTGIVQGTARLVSVERRPAFATYILDFGADKTGTAIGASIAIQGVCLTVTAVEGSHIHFDLMQETLKRTNLGHLKPGDRVNYEHAARYGDEIGGHVVSGHVHCTVPVLEVTRPDEDNATVTLALPADWGDYIFEKGFIALNGASLTVSNRQADRFSVHLIPETLRQTTFGDIREGELVNLEVDSQTQAIVDTVRRMLPDIVKRTSESCS
ncbi:riboflavin synthase subunit alpha [Hahella sp. SMD15-11]|uniref:Riboflavin synthase n=1 Tax=Thermohahella caldifontis TaxID=3142973 RepID=A0AB39UYE3_9GAMM